MRILVVSDLHITSYASVAFKERLSTIADELSTIDALIVAGDTGAFPAESWPDFFEILREYIALEKVWIMPGAMDYYGWDVTLDVGLRALATASGANFIQKGTLTFDGVRFVCCTLWTDYMLGGDHAKNIEVASVRMNDHRAISNDGEPFTCADAEALHRDHLDFIATEIRKADYRKVVVVTHFSPSVQLAGPIDELSSAFNSDLSEFIETYSPDLWLSGRTHRHFTAYEGKTLVRNVSFGHPPETNFDKDDVRALLLAGLIDTQNYDLLFADRRTTWPFQPQRSN